jgi:phosphoesterase RecJ-like protein
MEKQIAELVAQASHIVVVQADNPDADSLGSALALEHILGDLGKQVSLYCGVDIPTYLRYLSGWDRVAKDFPKQFDLSIIVDASTYTLLEQLQKTSQLAWLKAKPSIVLDHHKTVEKPLDFATVSLIEPEAASTGDIIYRLAKQNDWTLSAEAADQLMTSILGDTQGLTNQLTTAGTYRTMAALTDLGADRPKFEELRRAASKMAPIIYTYKGRLLQRTEFAADGKVAHVTVPQTEINEFSPLYNPAALIQFDMLQVENVQLSIVFKIYDDGHVTGAIRSSTPIAAKLAESLGGGGHDYASGFKTGPNQDSAAIKATCLETAAGLVESTV